MNSEALEKGTLVSRLSPLCTQKRGEMPDQSYDSML